MNQHNRIEVIDANGWRKEYPLQKPIVHIGSGSRNDIVLEPVHGAGVASLHVQLISSGNDSGCKLVNLADTGILLGEQVLPPRSVAKLTDGAVFKLGSFTLVFRSGEGVVGSFAGGSKNIGLSIYMSQIRLMPDQSLWGTVTVNNRGDRSGVQFDVNLEGIDSDCYDIEPGPLLSAGAEKEVQFRLYHRGIKPPAGERTITIHVSAPTAYPTDKATVTQTIYVFPCYHHQVRLLTSVPDEVETLPQAEKEVVAKSTWEPRTELSLAEMVWGKESRVDRSTQEPLDQQRQPAAQQPVEIKEPPVVSPHQVEAEPALPEVEEALEPEIEPSQATLPEQATPLSPESESSPQSSPLQDLPSTEPSPQRTEAQSLETEVISPRSSKEDQTLEVEIPPPPQMGEADEQVLGTPSQTSESTEDWWAETENA